MSDKDNESKDPWSQRQDQGPPDLLALIKKFFKSNPSKKNENGQPEGQERVSLYIWFVVGFILILWGLSGIFIVSPQEQSVVLRFGKYVATAGPGPHWIPRFIESKTTLNVQQVQNFSYQAEMLTKDENIVSVSLAVQYRVANPRDYLFNVTNPYETLQQATSSALRQVVGNTTLDSVLTTGRQKLRDNVEQKLNAILALYETGLEITDVNLQPAKPPEAVTDAFDDAIKAREDEQRYINTAKAYSRRVFSVAQGKVARITQSAEAYQKEAVLEAQGATARYLALLKPFKAAPGVTRERLYLDTVSNVLENTTNILVDTSGNNVLYLPLDQLLRQKLHGKAKQVSSLNNLTSPNNTDSSMSNNKTSSGYGESRPSYPSEENQ